MKYKVGDKVKIRKDLIECQQYGKMSFIGSGMVACKGRTAMIDEILDDGRYHINIDPEGFIWTDEMFEDECKYPSKFKIGDEVRVRKDLEVNKDYNGLTLSDAMYRCHDIMTIESANDDNYLCEFLRCG